AGLIKIAESYDLTMPQLYVLISMKNNTPLKMNEIAAMLACDPSNATGIIDRLFAHKYIERKESSSDRRVKQVSLTPKGAKLQNELIQKIAGYEPKALEKL